MVTKVNSLEDKNVIHFKGQIDDSINMINDDNMRKSVNKHGTKAFSKNAVISTFNTSKSIKDNEVLKLLKTSDCKIKKKKKANEDATRRSHVQQKIQLNQHSLQERSAERPYACDVCNWAFKKKSYLYRHRLVHSTERPYVCDVCSAAFKRKRDLNMHYRKHTGERPFTCDQCGSKFMQSSDLTVHYRKHTDERPFACDMCDGTFTSSANRLVHMRTHTGQRPYACDVCGLSFTQSHVLAEHARKHTGERPYECGMCGLSFVASGGLRKHRLRKHIRDV